MGITDSCSRDKQRQITKICEIWCFHHSDDSSQGLLGCDAM